uniref:Patronin n=1 Tax=Cacopsylla melanoneura TaxID=428564 RepID=A0A8D8LLC8_9HEMI
MERRTSVSQEGENSYDNRQAKQRATVKWLLSKAYNNKVPENVKEPFYKDHENQEHLKPQLVHSFSNAELYCLALANIYTDPNYHNLNHWGILRALNNKGIYPDKRLTETVLIQTNPLKLSAHLSVMEAIMSLYAKEVATPDRVVAAVERFSPAKEEIPLPSDHEAALVLWINEAVTSLNTRISQENSQSGGSESRVFPRIKDLHELSDGVGLAALVSFYCPEDLPHSSIVLAKVPTVSDCVRNLMLVYNFCAQCLPSPIFHMMPEDVGFMRGSMRSNLVVFLADLFNLLEIHPAQCVRFDRGAAPLTEVQPLAQSSPSIVKRYVSNNNNSTAGTAELNGGDESSFVVHRGKSIPTLSSMFQHNSSNNSNSNATSDNVPAGKPSNWEDTRGKTYYAGRRSRRNSLSDDSQLTVENFGGSQENLHFLGRNPDKQVAVHVGSREPTNVQSPRIIAQENRNSTSVHNVLVEAQSDEPIDTSRYTTTPHSRSNSISYPSPAAPLPTATAHQYTPSSRGSTQAAAHNASSSGLQNLLYDPPSPPPTQPSQNQTPPPLSQLHSNQSSTGNNSGANNYYASQSGGVANNNNSTSTNSNSSHSETSSRRMSTFATLPAQHSPGQAKSNTTTWQQQSSGANDGMMNNKNNDDGSVDTSQLMNIRLELEEKRRQIESEKRRAEAVISRQRQKMGKAAFFQAVSKDISEVEQKWSENGGTQGPPFVDHRKSNNNTPETLIDQYQHSIAQIQEMQSDIQRLTQQQHQQQHQQQQNPYHPQQHHPPNSHLIQQPPNNVLIQPPQPVTLHSFAGSGAAQPQPITMNYYAPPGSGSPQPAPQPVYQPTVITCDIVHQPSPPMQQWNNLSYQQQVAPSHHMLTQHVLHQHHPSASPSPPHHEMLMYQQKPVDSQNSQSIVYSSQQQQKPNYFHQQHEQVDRLIRSNDPNQMNQSEPGERFFLHDPHQNNTMSQQHNNMSQQHNAMNTNSSSRKSWNTPSSPQLINFAGVNSHNVSHNNSNSGSAPVYQQQQEQTNNNRNVWNTRNDNNKPNNNNSTSRSNSSNNNFTSQNGRGGDQGGAPTPPPRRSSQVSHAPIPAPPADDMEPQSISFIGTEDEEEDLSQGLSKMNITSGSRTYRIPSPTRQHVRNSISHQQQSLSSSGKQSPISTSTPKGAAQSPVSLASLGAQQGTPQGQPEKGFYISFDDDVAPKRPKPPLRAKKSPKKVTMDEMERKKERIMLQSLQRRQQQEEMKIRKELEAQRRRDVEKRKADEKERKKQEMEARRAAILESHRIKKALEKAEMEGDKEALYSLRALQQNLNLNNSHLNNSSSNSSSQGPPRLRGSKPSTSRPRPKTIHIDNHSSSDLADGMITPGSRGGKGSTSNLSVLSNASSNMRRDYYRGSQDCLAETRRTSSASFISDFGDDSRGTSPGRTMGRRGSYKTTSRGSSCDQDSMLYRGGGGGGDTDSGLGLGTPLRRAPSPHHPSSPSGPGSLPLHRIRNRFDDTVSESGSDYCGPRLYKQPTTKSNRGIILNAVEYCVFPGAVNRDAKHRVLDEIHRSETRHFLILFRDARCQFRALYAYTPDSEDGIEVVKLYGTGPKVVTDRMFDQFFKYNSGGKTFAQIHTKHLTVTIDAFTIHNSLWQGKKVNLPNKRDMSLVI